jgi:mannose-6-phosphate isomerase-like protein (cupin superfamily)
MINALLLSLLLVQAATPPKPPPKPQPTTPPKAAPAQPRTTPRQAANTVAGMAITVTDGKGTPFPDVTVEMTGAAAREGKTDAVGQLSFPGLRAGTYRLRFSGEGVTTFEREVTLKAGEIAKLPITLTPAAPVKVAPAPPPAAPAPPPAPAAGPVGQPQLGSLAKLAEQHRNTKERREVMLSCSGNTRNMLLALTDEQPQRIYDTAEATFYVLSGQGAAIVGKLQSLVTTGSFIAVPRGTPFVLARQGNRPLIMLWTLSGEPCEAAK